MVPENLEAANESAEWEIAGQIANASALDAKAIGVLAFMGAVGTVLLTVTNGLGSNRGTLVVGAAGSALWILIGMVMVMEQDLKSGPNAAKFYKDHGQKSREEFGAQLLADFGEILRRNQENVEFRQAMVSGAFVWAVIWAVIFGFLRAVA